MSATEPTRRDPPEELQRSRPGRARHVFGLAGGPAAWFVQLCLGDLLASGPCFRGVQRHLAPPSSLAWTTPTMPALMVLCALIALVACWVSWSRYRHVPAPAAPSDRGGLPDTHAGSTRFLALWGMVLGAGFCVATLLTAVAFLTLPRCAG